MKKLVFFIPCLLISLMVTAQVSKTVHLEEAGTLSDSLTPDEKKTVTNLTLTGNIDARDIKIMRDEIPKLEVLDLTKVIIKEYSGIGTDGNTNQKYPADEMPKRSFYKLKKGEIQLKKIIFPTNLITIRENAFENCSNLTGSLILPDHLDSIGSEAFRDCIGLTGNLALPNSITIIRNTAFLGCTGLTSLTLPNSLITIGNSCFSSCSGLVGTITIPNSVTTIGSHAFGKCENLSEIILGENLTYLDKYFLNDCESLTKITVSCKSPPKITLNTFYSLPAKCVLSVPLNKLNDYLVADRWKSLSLTSEITSSMKASSIVDGAECNLIVTNEAELTIDADKKYKSITVAPNSKLTLNDGNKLTLSASIIRLTLQSDATTTATFVDKNKNKNKIDISANVQQYLPSGTDRTWWYLAAPVVGAQVSIFGTNKIGEYSEANRSYSNPLTKSTSLAAGKGYVVKMKAAEAFTYSIDYKTLNTGDYNIKLTRTITKTADNAKRGFNLVGNPYPSYLDFKAAYESPASSNLRPTIWYRTSLDASMIFHTYNAKSNISSPQTATRYIPPMQAFWVRVDKDPENGNESKGILHLNNDMRSHDTSEQGNPLKAPAVNDLQLIRLTVSNGTLADETVIAAHPEATDNFDLYDSEKMSNDDLHRPELYSVAGSRKLVINTSSSFSHPKQFALGFATGKAGKFSIALSEYSNMNNMELVLQDKLENLDWILTPVNDYHFSSELANTQSRFSLLLRSKGSEINIEELESSLSVYAAQGSLWIESPNLVGATIRVYNALGQPVFATKAQTNIVSTNQTLIPGLYVLKVNNQIRKVLL